MARIPHNAMRIWHEQVDAAATIPQVVSITQDFISSLTPADLATVPQECRPGRIRDESDIDFWNLKLADACRALWGTDRDGQTLTEMSQLFQRASRRVSRLAEHPQPASHS